MSADVHKCAVCGRKDFDHQHGPEALQSSLTRLEGEHERLLAEIGRCDVAYDQVIGERNAARIAYSALVSSLTRLLEGGYARKLRLDASGENGRMSSSDMYQLADALDALTRLARSPEEK